MPETQPTTLMSRVQAKKKALGIIDTEAFKLTNIEHGEKPGDRIMTFTLQPEELDKFVKLFTIKEFSDIRDTITILDNYEARLLSVEGNTVKILTNINAAKQKWENQEQIKRAKSKNHSSELNK